MAVQKVYEAQIDARTGDTYRVCIYDLDYTSGTAMTQLYGEPQVNLPIELNVLHETPEIRWDGEPDKIGQPIVGSSFVLSLLLSTGDDNKIKDVIKSRPENTLAVEVERHNGATTSLSLASNWDVIWRGVLVHEAVEYSWSDYPQEISLTFTDGLSLLRDKAYITDTGDTYSSNGNRFAPLRVQIGRCLSELPHNALWGETELYFTEQLDLFHWNHVNDGADPDVIGSVLDKSGCNQDLWYEYREHESPYNRDSIIQSGGSTCYEILTDIMVGLGITISHQDGIFQAISPLLTTDDTVTLGKRRFRADKRTMLDPTYQYAAYTQTSGDLDGSTSPNSIDYRDPEKVLIGSSLSYLPGVKGMMMTHVKGGAPYAFFPTHAVRIVGSLLNVTEGPSNPGQGNYNPNAGGQVGGGSGSSNFLAGPTFPLQNTTTVAPGGESLRIKGRVFRVGNPIEDGDDNLVGIQPILRFKIKVGDYYLKQSVGLMSGSHFSNDSDFGNIRLAVGNIMSTGGTDITTWLPIEITDEVEWTTVESFFDLPYQLPGVNEPDIDTIEYDSGSGIEEYPVGVFTVRDNNHPNQMRFRNEHDNYDTDLMLDMVTPELPTAVSEHTGIEVDCTLRAYDNTGTLLTGSGNGNPDFGLNGTTEFCVGMYIDAFRVIVGLDETDEDTQYFASETNPPGSEIVNAGETTLASRPHDSYGEIGALVVGNGHRTTPLTGAAGYGPYWFSQSHLGDTIPTLSSAGRRSLEVLCEEYYRLRAQALNTVSVELLLESRYQTLLHPSTRVILEQGSSDPIIQVQACTHNLMTGVQVISGYEVERLSTGTVNADTSAEVGNTTKGPRGPGGIAPGPVATVRNRLSGGGGSGLTAEQITKLGAITVTGSNITDFTVSGTVLDNSNVSGSASTTTTATLQGQITNILRVTDNFTLNAEHNITVADFVANAINPTAINETSSKTFATSTQLAAIGTNTSNVSTLQTEVQAIEDVIQSVTSGGGKGVYFNSGKVTTNAHVTVIDKGANLFAGSNTGVSVTETSPGTVTLSVQAGSTGSEVQVDAMTITGSGTLQVASVYFASPVSFANGATGLNTTQISEGSKLFYTTARFDLRFGQSSVEGLNDVTSVGSGSIITSAERTKLNGIATSAIANVVEDLTPQLGGDLDINGNKIVSNSNGDIVLDPAGTGAIILKSDDIKFEGAGTVTMSSLKFFEASALEGNYVAFKSPLSITSDVTWILPAADGSANQVLKTDGSGNLTWATVVGATNPIVEGTLNINSVNSGVLPARLKISDDDGSHGVGLRCPDLTADIDFTLPATDGTSGQVLKTNGSGVLSFVDQTTDTNTSLGGTDQTLTADRVIDVDGNDLEIKDGSTNLLVYESGPDAFTISKPVTFTNSGGYTAGEIRLKEAPAASGDEYIALKAPGNVASSVTFTLPDADGSDGQVLKTDGSGVLSWVNAGGGGGGMTETPLIQASGRWQWSSADDGERVWTGSSAYGPTNWYSHSQEPTNSTLRTYSSSHSINTTTATTSPYKLFAYGHSLPSDSKKVRCKFHGRYQNANGTTMGWSMWHAATPSTGSTASVTLTLVGKSSDISPGSSSTQFHTDTFTTTSALSGGFILVLAENRAGSLASTTYVYGNYGLYLVD